MIGDRWAVLHETADIPGLSHTTDSRVYSKKSSDQQIYGRKRLVDERGEKRMARLVGADTKATVS